MKPKHARGGMLLSMCLVGAALVTPVPSWAQAASPGEAAAGPSSSGRAVLAGVGAVFGSMVYAPFKAAVMCPVGALASGATYAATGGERETPNYLLRLGCTGTYFITPAMVQGQEAFRRYDEP